MSLHPRLEVLPSAQRQLWPALASLPGEFVLYGGTAIALRLGHRTSVDFDYFTDEPLDADRRRRLMAETAWLTASSVLDSRTDTLVLSVDVSGDPVKLSFFGGIDTGCLAEPDRTEDGVALVASLDDLFAHKLKVIHDRAEGKDYQDIAELLRSGLSLARGLAGLQALFGPSVPPMVTIKALTHFADLNEPWRVPADLRAIIVDAVRALPDRWEPVERRSARLAGS